MAQDHRKTAASPLTEKESDPPHVDPRTGVQAAPVPGETGHDSEPPADPDMQRTGTTSPVEANDVMTGDRHAASVAPSNRGSSHTADHAMSTPSGSDRTGIETPKSDKSRKMLMFAVAAVVVILLILLLVPVEAEAATPLLSLMWPAL